MAPRSSCYKLITATLRSHTKILLYRSLSWFRGPIRSKLPNATLWKSHFNSNLCHQIISWSLHYNEPRQCCSEQNIILSAVRVTSSSELSRHWISQSNEKAPNNFMTYGTWRFNVSFSRASIIPTLNRINPTPKRKNFSIKFLLKLHNKEMVIIYLDLIYHLYYDIIKTFL